MFLNDVPLVFFTKIDTGNEIVDYRLHYQILPNAATVIGVYTQNQGHCKISMFDGNYTDEVFNQVESYLNAEINMGIGSPYTEEYQKEKKEEWCRDYCKAVEIGNNSTEFTFNLKVEE